MKECMTPEGNKFISFSKDFDEDAVRAFRADYQRRFLDVIKKHDDRTFELGVQLLNKFGLIHHKIKDGVNIPID